MDITAIFSNVEELYETNKTLLKDLVEMIPQVNDLAGEGTPCSPIGDVFSRHLSKFSGYQFFLSFLSVVLKNLSSLIQLIRYTTYLCNKDLSTRVVKKVESNSLFSDLMKDCRSNPECNSLGLGIPSFSFYSLYLSLTFM